MTSIVHSSVKKRIQFPVFASLKFFLGCLLWGSLTQRLEAKDALLLLAPGAEESEVAVTVDILRRAKVTLKIS